MLWELYIHLKSIVPFTRRISSLQKTTYGNKTQNLPEQEHDMKLDATTSTSMLHDIEKWYVGLGSIKIHINDK